MLRILAVAFSVACAVPAAAQTSGPVGSVLTVDAASAPTYGYKRADIAYSPTSDRYLSVWADADGTDGNYLRGVMIDPATGTRGTPFDLQRGMTVLEPRVAWNPGTDTFLVVYSAFEGLYGRIVTATGTPVGSAFSISSAGIEEPCVASDGTSWLVVWDEGTIRGRVVEGESDFAGPSFLIDGAAMSWAPFVAYSSGYFVAWRNDDPAAGVRIGLSISGRSVASDGTLGTRRDYDPAFLSNVGDPTLLALPDSGGFVLGWIDQEPQGGDTYEGIPVFCRIDATGLVVAGPAVVDGAEVGTRWALGSTLSFALNETSGQVLATWIEDTHLYAARLDAANLGVAETGIVLGWGVNTTSPLFGAPPAIAVHDPDSRVIVQWQEAPSLFANAPTRAQRYDLGQILPSVTGADQYEFLDGSTVIAPGATTASAAIIVKGTVSSPAAADVAIEVEVRLDGSPFTGDATHTGIAVSSGAVAAVVVDGLAHSSDYHWQVRAVDTAGRVSAWTVPGGSPDFRTGAAPVVTPPTPGTGSTGASESKSGHGCASSAPTTGAAAIGLLMMAAIVTRRRIL